MVTAKQETGPQSEFKVRRQSIVKIVLVLVRQQGVGHLVVIDPSVYVQIQQVVDVVGQPEPLSNSNVPGKIFLLVDEPYIV